MKPVHCLARLFLLCAAGALFTATLACAQMGVPDVPTGTGPHCVISVPVESSTPGLPGVGTPWRALALRTLFQPAWPFLSVVPPTSWPHPAVLRESRGWSLSVSRAAAGRLIRR